MLRKESVTGNVVYLFDGVHQIDEFTNYGYWNDYAEHDSFTGRSFRSFEEYKEELKRVWDHGIDIIKAALERLEKIELPEVRSRKRATAFTEDEGEFDYERFMSGQDAFRKSSRESHDGPGELTIITDTTTPSNKDAEDIIWRGAVALALTKLLEQKGYAVELWVINGSNLFRNDFETKVCTACRLKTPADPLDMSTLLNTVSGWFYRISVFCLLRTICERENRAMEQGFGQAYSPRKPELDLLNNDEFRIYSSGTFSFSGAVQQIQAEVQKICVRDQRKD